MKKKTGWLILALAAILILSPVRVRAEETTTYKVRIFAGTQGSFGGSDVLELTVPYGEHISFQADEVTMPENSKYYVRGIREAGKDNDEVANSSVPVTRDMDYVVAYGVRGKTAAYTVSYVNAATGAKLGPDKIYYGHVGDKPVIAYQYFEGYVPRYYNITLRLSENEAENVIRFEYTVQTPAADEEKPDSESESGESESSRPESTAAENGSESTAAQSGEASEAESAEESAEPEEILDLEIPQAGPEEESGSETGENAAEETASAHAFTTGQLAAFGAAGIALIALIIFLIIMLKRRA